MSNYVLFVKKKCTQNRIIISRPHLVLHMPFAVNIDESCLLSHPEIISCEVCEKIRVTSTKSATQREPLNVKTHVRRPHRDRSRSDGLRVGLQEQITAASSWINEKAFNNRYTTQTHPFTCTLTHTHADEGGRLMSSCLVIHLLVE